MPNPDVTVCQGGFNFEVRPSLDWGFANFQDLTEPYTLKTIFLPPHRWFLDHQLPLWPRGLLLPKANRLDDGSIPALTGRSAHLSSLALTLTQTQTHNPGNQTASVWVWLAAAHQAVTHQSAHQVLLESEIFLSNLKSDTKHKIGLCVTVTLSHKQNPLRGAQVCVCVCGYMQ